MPGLFMVLIQLKLIGTIAQLSAATAIKMGLLIRCLYLGPIDLDFYLSCQICKDKQVGFLQAQCSILYARSLSICYLMYTYLYVMPFKIRLFYLDFLISA